MTRIIGVDPGSRLAGYSVIEANGRSLKLLAHGTLKLKDGEMPDRLSALYNGINQVIAEFHPEQMAVEKAFFAKNVNSALVLGQARGVIILCGAQNGLTIHEYPATVVKQSVVGSGHADKDQVAKMIQILLGRQDFTSSDASDAVAIALCHALRMRFPLTRNSPRDKTVL